MYQRLQIYNLVTGKHKSDDVIYSVRLICNGVPEYALKQEIIISSLKKKEHKNAIKFLFVKINMHICVCI